MSATARILTGLAAGAILGLPLASLDPATGVQVGTVVQPFGKPEPHAPQMTVVPLVLALVIVGVNTASDAAASGRVARRAILVFVAILAGAAAFAAVAAPALLSLFTPYAELAAALHQASGGDSAVASVAPA